MIMIRYHRRVFDLGLVGWDVGGAKGVRMNPSLPRAGLYGVFELHHSSLRIERVDRPLTRSLSNGCLDGCVGHHSPTHSRPPSWPLRNADGCLPYHVYWIIGLSSCTDWCNTASFALHPSGGKRTMRLATERDRVTPQWNGGNIGVSVIGVEVSLALCDGTRADRASSGALSRSIETNKSEISGGEKTQLRSSCGKDWIIPKQTLP